MLVLNFYVGVTPLLVTGHSRTVSQLFTRYLSTTMHVNNWFTYDPFDPRSKSYRSLKVVRAYHQQVAAKLNQATGCMANCKPWLWMNQWAMCHAQFTFMGFMTVFRDKLGFRLFTPADYHAMFHFWRVIGYCLGIEDDFNLCSGSDEEIFELCRQNYYDEWMPVIKSGEKMGMAMANGIALSHSVVVPGIRYRGMMRYAAPILSLDKNEYRLRGFWDVLSYIQLWIVLKVYSRSRFILWNINWMTVLLMRIAVWLRRFNVWRLDLKYPASKYSYESDDRCPVQIAFNYRTAFDLNLH